MRVRLWFAFAVLALAVLVFASTALGQNYIIVYKAQSVSADAATTIEQAGGALVYAYPQIGVVVANSNSPEFRANLLKDSRVDDASGTSGFATQVAHGAGSQLDSTSASGAWPGSSNAPVNGQDNLAPLQWDMTQIHTPEAHAITGGSPSILVGDIDTGLDYTHPDLAPNVDSADSVNCVSGVPIQGAAAANDDNGHGTHTAGTIAAAANGIGIVSVAPNVRIAGIKAGNAHGFFFPEAVVCSFMWAATHGFAITNNSYFADPWLFNCRNDPGQRAIWDAERRAIEYAMSRGVTVVAAADNQADDLAHPTQDATSPDDTSPVLRTVHNDCAVIPVEIPGVIGVSADGNLGLKSFYSNYGAGVVQVTAPGGDSRLQRTSAAPNGQVLSTWPSSIPCNREVIDGTAVYCYLQGTSMASPHVAGLAALIESQYGKMMPGRLQAIIDQTADSIACPDAATLALYAFFPAVDNGAPQSCTGGSGDNSWYGHGQANALAAVTHAR
jgi:lantibiotic leader peptide-processing serine protease